MVLGSEMRQSNINSLGIVLKRINYGEADRIITILTKDFGKVTLLAKGVRRPKSKKRGHLEIFSYIKFSASNTDKLGMLYEVELQDSFPKIRKSLKKMSVAYYMCETINRVVLEREGDKELFDFCFKSIKSLENLKLLGSARLDFVRTLLGIAGFWPKGKELLDPDAELEKVTERKSYTIRVGKQVLTPHTGE